MFGIKAYINIYCCHYTCPKIENKYVTCVYDYIKYGIIKDCTDDTTNYYYGIISEIKNNFDLMIKYYKICINNGNIDAMNALGVYHWKQKNNKLAMYYLKKAHKIDPTFAVVSYNLGIFYGNNSKYDKMKKYYKNAIKYEYYDAALSLGRFYHKVKFNKTKMKKYYNIAIKNNCSKAPFKMSKYYFHINKLDKMLAYLNIAKKRGNTKALNKLGLYHETFTYNFYLMEKFYRKAVFKGDYKMIHNLFNFYCITCQYVKAIEIAFEGNIESMINKAINHITRYKIYPSHKIVKFIVSYDYKPTSYKEELEFLIWKKNALVPKEI